MNKPAYTIYPDLRGKTVFITGSNRGIGSGLTDAFIENGCRVILLYRSEPPALSTIDGNGHEAILLQGDITDIEAISKWLNEFGEKIDVLVNNAGVNLYKPLIDIDEADWDRIIDTNLKATFFMSQLFAKHMRKHSGGTIINAHSFAVKLPSATTGIYAASKAGLAMLTRIMAAEWAPHGIRVNAYSPGVVETEMTAPAIAKNPEKMLEAISLNRFGTTQDVANAVLFLSSDASSYITGVDLEITGGKFLLQNSGDLKKC